MADLIRGYRFKPAERRAWNNFASDDERGAYLDFARGIRQSYPGVHQGHQIIHLWRYNPRYEGKYTFLDRTLILSDNDRNRRIHTRPHVERYSGPADLEAPTADVARSDIAYIVGVPHLTYRFARCFVYGYPDDAADMVTTVRLYIGEDVDGLVQDRIVLKSTGFLSRPTLAVATPPAAMGTERTILNEISAIYQGLTRLSTEYILKPLNFGEEVRHNEVRDVNGNRTDAAGNILDANGNIVGSVPPIAGGPPMHEWYRGIRSCTQYCEEGTLSDVMNRYFDASQDNPQEYKKIPEIFLLWIFRAMGMALYSLESGLEFDRTNLRPPTHHGWTPLIHRDIKPANIFIRRPETDGGYPLPVLADFDLAVLAPNGRAIPEDMGTIGFKPPEQVRYLRANDPKTDLTTPKSDVWALGSAIWDVMRSDWGVGVNEVRNKQEDWFDDPNRDNDFGFDLPPGTEQGGTFDTMIKLWPSGPNDAILPDDPSYINGYTRALRNLVSMTTTANPDARYDATDVALKSKDALHDIYTLIDADPLTDGTKYDFGKMIPGEEVFQTGKAYNITRRRKSQ